MTTWTPTAGGARLEHGAHGDPHESPWPMAVPLVVLGALAAVGGIIDLPWGKWDFLTRWLAPGAFPAAIASPNPMSPPPSRWC